MIPESDVDLTPAEAARWRLTQLAYAIVRDLAVPIDLVMRDVREGCEQALASIRRADRRATSPEHPGDVRHMDPISKSFRHGGASE
ncbi:hypothetical protein [Amycolatopsis sp. NPDC058986]|uniref:hypothetical protein n=1 Tax=unclassified Amycolatopsis TaxID=2618356 RepID=UPI0036729A90